jgi:superfamily I DNA/RNA helicase
MYTTLINGVYKTNNGETTDKIVQPLFSNCNFEELDAAGIKYYKYDETFELNDMYADYVCGSNIICNSVAGSGKTTMLINMHLLTPSKKTLVLTYNKRLQIDVSERLSTISSDNISIFTFHGYATRVYGDIINDDDKFDAIIEYDPEHVINYDVIMIDEAQDLTPTYLAFAKKIFGDAQLVVVGDLRQRINENAIVDFTKLEIPNVKFHNNTKSYRINTNVAKFLNKHIYLENSNIVGAKDGKAPKYITCKSIDDMVFKTTLALSDALSLYKPSDIYILLPSLIQTVDAKKHFKNFLVKLMEKISTMPVTLLDSFNKDRRDTLNSVVIMTYHSSKGCERKCVILPNMDESYFDFFGKQYKECATMPNIINVALTRASETLIILARETIPLRTIQSDFRSDVT